MQLVLQKLLDLQNVDVRLNEVRTRLAAFPKKLADADARAASAKAELDQSKAAQLASFKDRKKYELDVEQFKERVRKYRDQTSQVKTNEAYKALQHEVQMAEDEIAKAEDRLLEQMVAGEEYDRRIKKAEAALKDVEADVRVQRATIEENKTAAEKSLAEFAAERAAVVAEIPENLREGVGVESLGHAVRADRRLAKTIVFLPFLHIGKHGVRVADFLETLGLLLVAAGGVWMVQLGQLAIGLLEGVGVGRFRHAENGIKVFHG